MCWRVPTALRIKEVYLQQFKMDTRLKDKMWRSKDEGWPADSGRLPASSVTHSLGELVPQDDGSLKKSSVGSLFLTSGSGGSESCGL